MAKNQAVEKDETEQENSIPDSKTVAVKLPLPIHRKLRYAAIENDTSMAGIVEEAIAFYLKRNVSKKSKSEDSDE